MKTTERLKALDGWVSLTDVQWMNIVNHKQAWLDCSKDDAVHEAVKMVEAKCKENNSATIKELCELVELMEEALESAANPFPRHGVVQAIADEALARVAKFQKGE